MLLRSILACSLAALATAVPITGLPPLRLATFGVNAPTSTTYKWHEQSDPVMGGQSSGNFSVVGDHGVFAGVVRNVSFLSAPGFCRITTGSLLLKDASKYLHGGLQLLVRTTTPSYGGYRMAFSAVGVPVHNGGHEIVGSYKAPFTIPPTRADAGKWHAVNIPFTDFSWDWSDYTGSCATKDPNGYQHKCCSTHPEVCPNKETMSAIDGFEVWAEGAEGDFAMEVQSIGAYSTAV